MACRFSRRDAVAKSRSQIIRELISESVGRCVECAYIRGMGR